MPTPTSPKATDSTEGSDTQPGAPDTTPGSTSEAVSIPDGGSPDPAAGAAAPRVRWRRTKWVFTRRLCFGGLAGALVFVCLSVTPSLLPREELMQGAVTGAAAAIGYGLGSLLSSALRMVIRREPSRAVKRRAWWALGGAAVVMVGLFLYLGVGWQRDLRSLMGMEPLGAVDWLVIVMIAVAVFLILLVIARVVRGTTRALIRFGDRFWSHTVTVNISVAVVALLLVGFAQGVLFNGMVTLLNNAYSVIDTQTNSWISAPTSALRSGGPGSLVAWESLGTKGRDFTGVGNAPTVAEIEAFSGQPATEPIRVYVGLDSADESRERINLAMDELDRTNAFDRSVLVVNTTTGTGWVDENVADSIEFLHGGDVAQVALQYSFLPSWVSFLADTSKAEEAGEQLITAVTDRINTMAPDDRPALLVFGESLGSFGTEAAFTSPENMAANVDGALLVGPTFVNALHEELTAQRDEGSPVWRPTIDGGRAYRFAVDPKDLSTTSLYPAGAVWGRPRIVYLQNSSDPITYFSPGLLVSQPEWMQGQRGPDVSEAMFWMPLVTFLQVAADLAFSMDVPAGHGHRYGSNVVEGWVQVSAPQGWTAADTSALRELIDARAGERNARQ